MAAPRSPEEERMQLAMALNASTMSSARTNQYREDLARALRLSGAHTERESEQVARAQSVSMLVTEAREAGNAFVNGLRTSNGGGGGGGGGGGSSRGGFGSVPVATPMVRGLNRCQVKVYHRVWFLFIFTCLFRVVFWILFVVAV